MTGRSTAVIRPSGATGQGDPGPGHLGQGYTGPAPVPARVAFESVDLSRWYNNRAASHPDETRSGAFNVWGNSFPADELPPAGECRHVGQVPFVRAPGHDGGDNVRCDGQYLPLPAVRADWLHVLVAAERRAETEVALHFAGGAVDFEALRVSDFWAAAPAAFGESLAVATSVMHYPNHVQPQVPAQLWAQRVPVTRQALLAGLRLPRQLAIHVLALTVQVTELSATEEGTR